MRSLLPLRKETQYSSVVWHDSRCFKHVSFAIRRPSLAQRIDLTERVRALTLKHEFLKAGDSSERLTASISELLVEKLYVEWGLAGIRGLEIDGELADLGLLIERGPEQLIAEIVSAIRAESELSDDERKNS